MNTSRTLLLAPIAALGLASCNLINAPYRFETATPNLDGVTTLEVSVYNGPITITRAETASLRIGKRGSVNVSVEQLGDRLRIVQQPPSLFCFGCSVNIEFTVPKALNLQLTTSNGGVGVTGQMNDAHVTTSNGGIRITNLGSKLKLITSNGQIEVQNALDVDARSSNVGMRIGGINGAIQLKSSNGGITLMDTMLPAGSQNTITTSNGGVTVQNTDTSGGFMIEGQTSNSGVGFSMTGFALQLERSSFIANRTGANPTMLKLHTSNGGIQVSP